MLDRLKGLLERHGLLTLRFGLVGVLATLVHTGVAMTALSLLHRPLLSNLFGFLAAFGVSFLGHALWTFKLEVGRWRAARRFFVPSPAAASCSAPWCWPPASPAALPLNAVSLMISIVVIPVCNYVAARLWAFAQPTLDGPGPA